MSRTVELPMTPEEARALRVGDEVRLRGRLLTARAAAHRWLCSAEAPDIRERAAGSILYHCGPVVDRDAATGSWRLVAAGPSSSMQAEPWEAEVLARYDLRGVMGKGGMGPATLEALATQGAVYLHAVGGLAVVLARSVVRVHGVYRLEELGPAEALWDVEVDGFPAVVTMDAHRTSLHQSLHGEPANLAKQLMG